MSTKLPGKASRDSNAAKKPPKNIAYSWLELQGEHWNLDQPISTQPWMDAQAVWGGRVTRSETVRVWIQTGSPGEYQDICVLRQGCTAVPTDLFSPLSFRATQSLFFSQNLCQNWGTFSSGNELMVPGQAHKDGCYDTTYISTILWWKKSDLMSTFSFVPLKLMRRANFNASFRLRDQLWSDSR